MASGTRRGAMAWVGVAFAVLFIGVFAAGGETPDEGASARKIIDFYNDHSGQARISAFAMVIAAVALVLFAGRLRQTLRGDAPRGWTDGLALAAFGGAVIYAIGLGIFAISATALVNAADRNDATVAVALNTLDNSTFFGVMIGMALVLLASGLAALRSATLPRWLAWVSVVLGVLAMAGPGGFVAFFAFPFWVVAVGFTARQPVDAPAPSDALVSAQ